MLKQIWRLLALTLTITIAYAVTVFGQTNPVKPPAAFPMTVDDTQKINAISTSDDIFVATVAEVKLPATLKTPTPGDTADTFMLHGRQTTANLSKDTPPSNVTLKIDKVLFGKFKASETVTIPLQLKQAMAMNKGNWYVIGWTPELTINQQYLFLLQRTNNCYNLPMESRSVLPVNELPQWETVIANMPILVSPLATQTSITFGGATLAKLIVRNTTDEPISIAKITFSGYYLGKNMDANIKVSLTDPPEGAKADTIPSLRNPLQLAPKTDQTITLYLTASPPQSWSLFGEESFMMTPVAIRTQVMATIMGEHDPNIAKLLKQLNMTGSDRKKLDVNFSSPLATMYVGYPLTRDE